MPVCKQDQPPSLIVFVIHHITVYHIHHVFVCLRMLQGFTESRTDTQDLSGGYDTTRPSLDAFARLL